MQSIAMSVSVCLSVCPLGYLKNHMSKLHKKILYVLPSHGSVLFWRWWTMLCTSGSVDDVKFSHNGSYGLWRGQYLRQRSAEASSIVINFQRIRQGCHVIWPCYRWRHAGRCRCWSVVCSVRYKSRGRSLLSAIDVFTLDYFKNNGAVNANVQNVWTKSLKIYPQIWNSFALVSPKLVRYERFTLNFESPVFDKMIVPFELLNAVANVRSCYGLNPFRPHFVGLI